MKDGEKLEKTDKGSWFNKSSLLGDDQLPFDKLKMIVLYICIKFYWVS